MEFDVDTPKRDWNCRLANKWVGESEASSGSSIDAQRSEIARYFWLHLCIGTIVLANIIQFPPAFIQEIISIRKESSLKFDFSSSLSLSTECSNTWTYRYDSNNLMNRLFSSFISPALPPYSVGRRSFGTNLYNVSEFGLWKWS